jgi:predicted secreted Zn-dependent protease
MEQSYTITSSSNRGQLNSFKRRLFKLYLPLIVLGLGLIFDFTLQKPAPVQAAPITKISYSGVYSSGGNSSSSPAPVPAVSQTGPVCSPDGGFQPVGAVSADGGQTGLVQQIDQPYVHKMYGYTASQLAGLSRQCPLVIAGDNEPFVNAYTSYWIGWQYSYSAQADGQCRIDNPQVLLHIREALPVWQNSAQADAGLRAQWQAYASAVNTHEAGHVKLIQQSANQLLSSLQNLPSQACGSIKQAVDNLGADYVKQLASANENYDISTQHGAAQGAIVP